MANKNIPLAKVREVLRLKLEEKMTNRAIARKVGISHPSVGYLSRQLLEAGLTWHLELSDEALQALLYKQREPYVPVRPLPDFAEIQRKLESGISLTKQWRKYLEVNPDGFQFTRFKTLYRQWEMGLIKVQKAANPGRKRKDKHKSVPKSLASLAQQDESEVPETIGEALRNAEAYWYSEIDEKAVLTLAGHGARIQVDRDELVIMAGTSATSVNEPEKRLARAVHGIRAIVMVGYAGYVTLDAIEWLAQQNIALYTLDLVGSLCLNLVPAMAPHRPTLRRAQYDANPLLIARTIVKEKLSEAVRVKPELEFPYKRIHQDISRTGSLDMLRLAEGRAANLYWNQWRFELPHHKDFPEHWRTFTSRGSPLSGSGRKAVHPVNAMLNYAYTILAGRIERALVFEGFDPAVGTLHADMEGRASLAWDLIELLRPSVDEQLIGWMQTQTWRKRDFEVNEDGNVFLRQQLARVVVQKGWIPDAKIKQVIRWYVGMVLGRKEAFAVR